MKKLILCGLAGVLAMLLVQSPADLQAMDSGMMGSDGYRGYDMGPGLIRYGGYQADGMGPSMMGSSKKIRSLHHQSNTILDEKSAERIFEDYLKSRHNPNLKLGEIKDEGSIFEAELLTKDKSLVDKLIVDKNNGRIHSAY